MPMTTVPTEKGQAMSRYIDADAYKDAMGGVYGEYWEEVLDSMGDIDIVRCKECRYWRATNRKPMRVCTITGFKVNSDDFCSYGERAEQTERSE